MALGGQPVSFEATVAYRNGRQRSIHASYVPDRDAGGTVRGFVAVVQDVTAQADAIRQLRIADERLTLAAAAAGLGDWSVDVASGRMTLSDRAAAILGVAAGDHPRGLIRPMINEHDYQLTIERTERALRDRTDFDVVYRLTRPDGAVRWISGRGRGLYNPDGALITITGVVQDISTAKETESALRDETEALRIINETGRMLSAELDHRQLVQRLTDAATELTGAQFGAFFYSVADSTGVWDMLYTLTGVARESFERCPMPRASDLFGPAFPGEGAVRIGDVRQDPRFTPNPPSHLGMTEGTLTLVSFLAVPVISRTGEVPGALFFGHAEPDAFTERHERIVVGLSGQAAIAIDNARLFEAAELSRQAAEAANRLKDEFLATVSHELRTPLNAIMGWGRLLAMGALTEADRARAIEIIQRNALVQQRIIEDILDVSRIIAGKLRLDITAIDLGPSVNAAIESVRPTATAKGVALVTDLNAKIGRVHGDGSRIQQMVWNLASNAIKFTPRGGTVLVSARAVESFAEIAVADTGIGIATDFLPHVFDRFRQADSSTTRVHGGVGLGLAIVRHLAELHGGTVEARSDGLGRGATFIVRLPLDEQPAASGERPEPRVAIDAAQFQGTRILVIDDEADARELVRLVLAARGAQVRVASSAQEALLVLDAWKPAVIICDIAMPDQDGYALITEVRARPIASGGAVPAIALTAYAHDKDRDRAIEAGYQVHLPKPLDAELLAATVAQLL